MYSPFLYIHSHDLEAHEVKAWMVTKMFRCLKFAYKKIDLKKRELCLKLNMFSIAYDLGRNRT